MSFWEALTESEAVLDVTPYELLGGTDGVGSRSNPSDMILIDKNSEYGSAIMDFLALDRGNQGRLLGYLKALTEMRQDS